MATPDGRAFDLRALEIFHAVCESGSMAAAARALRLTQPAVSQAIAEAEARAGVKLFDRGVRPLGLTAAGTVLRQRAGGLIAELRQIAPLLREVEAGRPPILRIGLVDSLSRVLMTPLAKFLAARADQVSILSGLTASHVDGLLTRRLDIFIGVDELADLDGLERIALCAEPYILASPRSMAAPNEPGDLAARATRLPLVRFSARSKTGLEIERHLRRLRLEIPRRLEFDTPYGVASAVAAGQGWAITTPLCVLEAGIPTKGLRFDPLPGPALGRTLTLVARDRELGRLPRDIAIFATSTLRATRDRVIARLMPWAAAQISVGESDDASRHAARRVRQ
jgi:DNA-binding transcriptional LysR family regulator